MNSKTCASPGCTTEITRGNYCKRCMKGKINKLEKFVITKVCSRDHDEETDRELEDMENLVLFPDDNN